MGLDQYIFRVRKLYMPEGTFTSEEINERGLTYRDVEYVEERMHLYKDLMPYMDKRMVTDKFLNIEKIERDYHVTNVNWYGFTGNVYNFHAIDDSGNRKRIDIVGEIIEDKYTLFKTFEAYIWYKEEVHYWRKNYDLQDWINGDNLQYTILFDEHINYINDNFNADIPALNPTEEEALFYWEWY